MMEDNWNNFNRRYHGGLLFLWEVECVLVGLAWRLAVNLERWIKKAVRASRMDG